MNIIYILNYLNLFRIKYQAPPLIYSNMIATSAQLWADYLANTNQFIHSNDIYGENVGKLWNNGNITGAVIDTINMGMAESMKYNYCNPSFDMAGHFTQNVWVSSRELGVGVGINSNNYYVVMQFNPPGNYIGSYKNNVLCPRC
jgi:uncharacterized protein YkwD